MRTLTVAVMESTSRNVTLTVPDDFDADDPDALAAAYFAAPLADRSRHDVMSLLIEVDTDVRRTATGELTDAAKVANAATMYGTGSPQHLATIRRFSPHVHPSNR